MKRSAAIKHTLIILWIISVLLFSLCSSYAQQGSGTGVRGVRKIDESVPNPVATPSPTVITSPSPIVAPSPTPNNSPITESNKPRPPLISPEPSKPEPIATEIQSDTKAEPNQPDPELEQMRRDALKEYYSAVRSKNQAAGKSYEYNNWALENRKGVFNWQHLSGKTIFCVVLFLVLTGVVFSGIQFFIAMELVGKRKGVVNGADTQEREILPTTIKASLNGIEVSSSILGVIILIVSFLFFYLYLAYVYPITVISG